MLSMTAIFSQSLPVFLKLETHLDFFMGFLVNQFSGFHSFEMFQLKVVLIKTNALVIGVLSLY